MALEGELDFTGHVSEQLFRVAEEICKIEDGVSLDVRESSDRSVKWTGNRAIFPEEPSFQVKFTGEFGEDFRVTQGTFTVDGMGINVNHRSMSEVLKKRADAELDRDGLALDILKGLKDCLTHPHEVCLKKNLPELI